MPGLSNSNRFLLFLVLLGGIVFGGLILNEYRLNIGLLENNRTLLKSIVKNTLRLFVEDDLNRLPRSAEELKARWRELPNDVYWFKNGEQVFPFLFSGDDQPKFDAIWGDYINKAPSQKVSEDVRQRRILVENLLEAIRSKEEPAMRVHLERFLEHKQHYTLLPHEEIASWLVLFMKEDRWSQAFAQTAIIDGWPTDSGRLSSVADILFSESALMSREDMKSIYQLVLKVSYQYELPVDNFKYYYQKLFQPLELKSTRTKEVIVQSDGWLIIPRFENEALVVAADMDVQIDAVSTLLQSQGLLEEGDVITVSLGSESIPLEKLEFEISKKSWENTLSEQRLYFFIKIVFLLVFVLLMLILIFFFQQSLSRKKYFLDMQKNFINLISHELKTPLSSIKIMAETLEKRIANRLDPRDYTHRILDESEKLHIMLENILSFSQLEGGTVLSCESTNIADLVRLVVEDASVIKGGKLKCFVDLPDDIMVKGNAVLFSLVFKNILSNALKYNNNEFVTFDVRYDGSANTILCKDNGVGIDEENWLRVFEKFYRVGKLEKKRGMGLGLALSREIMRYFKGDLSIAHSSDVGTTWVVLMGAHE